MRWNRLDRACRAFRSVAMLVAVKPPWSRRCATSRWLRPQARRAAVLVGGAFGGNIVAR
jgi:hypothetical protein